MDLTTQRDSYKQKAEEWKKAAKGGSAWRRFVKAANYVGIGALISGGTVAAVKH